MNQISDAEFLASAGVLLAEDQDHMRSILRRVLKSCGIRTIFEASDGAIARNLLRDYRGSLDRKIPGELSSLKLIISDWKMPEVSGIELLKLVREDEALSKLPFIMLTGENEMTNVEQAAHYGIQGYLVKPVAADVLSALVHKTLLKK